MRLGALLLLPGLLDAQTPMELRLREDVSLLASPALEGRGNGEPGLDRAARHVEAHYRKLGLKPEIQRFGFVSRVIREHGECAVRWSSERSEALRWGKDVEALGWSADGDLKGTPFCFVRFGLLGGGHEDFREDDVKGRVAVLVRELPRQPAFQKLPGMTRSLLGRVQQVAKAGAAAVVVLETGDTPAGLRREDGPLKLGIPVLSLPARVWGLEKALGGLLKTQSMATFSLPESLDLRLRLSRPEAQLPNVMALLPGSDPAIREEVVVVGAHLDHLGKEGRHSLLGTRGQGQVHAGADDNASGTAVVMEIARSLKELKPRRSILFIHFAGEEEGLLGSAHWIRVPTVPLTKVRFMLNFDMVGRLDPRKPVLQLGGLGAPKEALQRARTFAPEGVSLGEDLGAAAGGSDHMSFSTARIPTFFFFTGLHGDYHRPSDTAERLNVKGMSQVADMGAKVALDLANSERVPDWDPETAKLPQGRRTGGARIAFGTIPDFKEDPDGFRINGTSPGSTAESLGLKAGDVLVQFGERPIRSIYDFMEALSSHQPGEKVLVQWKREGRQMQGEAVLRGR